MDAREGFFRAASVLVNDPSTATYTANYVRSLMIWFTENLAIPDRFSKSNSKGRYERYARGISWFKPSATEHIARAFELASILEQNGFSVDILKEKRLGYGVYEDEYQIVAEPFSDTST